MEEIKPCPFCGRPCYQSWEGTVYCLSGEYDEFCTYAYGDGSKTSDEVLSAHNRVSDAVAAQIEREAIVLEMAEHDDIVNAFYGDDLPTGMP